MHAHGKQGLFKVNLWERAVTPMADWFDVLHRFADWPNREIPQVAAGVYAIWRDSGEFIYVGMSGKGIETVDPSRNRFGLYTRLNSHASGRLSGDQFCVYVANRLVIPELTEDQRSRFASGELNLDGLTRAYVREHFHYSYALVGTAAEAFTLERDAQRGLVFEGKPLLNPL
jgi:hypothetical protein